MLNIVIIMTDQQRADLCAREGYPLDTTPFIDSLARKGAWFTRAYTSMPACAPARVSMFTGRYPSATRVRTNHNIQDACYSQDLVDVLKDSGYVAGMCGKNHSHLTKDRFDYWYELGHDGGSAENEMEQQFDDYLRSLRHRADCSPAPFPLECQGPYRAVSHAINWLDSLDRSQPFFLWVTFAEPHNPYQVPEPYYSLFPPDSLLPPAADESSLSQKGFKWQWNRETFQKAFPDYDKQYPHARANYHGMLRLIDDQVKRFVEFLEEKSLRDTTLVVFLSDHGDFVGEYGLVRKGPDVPECLSRIPLIVTGPGIPAHPDPRTDHVSIADIMPTLCEALDVPLPDGVQGRSLWPMLTGKEYPAAEFFSAYVEHGFGGLHYTADDSLDPAEEGALNDDCSYDCLNSWTQSGQMRMVRKDEWKLVFDMQRNGQLYNLADDPAEVHNVFGQKEYCAIQVMLLEELLVWTLRVQDPLPLPRRRYIMKKDPRNYWTPYQ